MEIRIKSGTDVPIYQQIVDAVQEQISSGVLAEGQKLPTVRQLAEEMGLAKGTIKRAYDELERCGAIRMTQGKGTFVLELRRRTDSHKEQAMQAIDRMLDELEALDFSPREIEIFFDLKLRARMDRGAGLRVAVTDCNVEALALIADQIAAIGGIELFRFTLDEVMNAPYKLSDSMDVGADDADDQFLFVAHKRTPFSRALSSPYSLAAIQLELCLYHILCYAICQGNF